MKKIVWLWLAASAVGAGPLRAQDVIVKKDGIRIEAKVLEIGPAEMKYKKFSNPDGPTYVLPISDLVCIRYVNGDRDVFSQSDYDRLQAQDAAVPVSEAESRSAVPAAPGPQAAAVQGQPYRPGSYYEQGDLRGIVVSVDSTGFHGVLMSLDEISLRWCDRPKAELRRIGAADEYDGRVNMQAVGQAVAAGAAAWSDFPAFEWCRRKGEGWYLPAINELLQIGSVYNNGRSRFDRKARETFNEQLRERGGSKMARTVYYLSSTESSAGEVYVSHMDMEPPFLSEISKNTAFMVRALHRF